VVRRNAGRASVARTTSLASLAGFVLPGDVCSSLFARDVIPEVKVAPDGTAEVPGGRADSRLTYFLLKALPRRLNRLNDS
jgi:hypothetical protein